MAGGDTYLEVIGQEGFKGLDLLEQRIKDIGALVKQTNGDAFQLFGFLKNNKSFAEFNKFYTDAKKLIAELRAEMASYEKATIDQAKAEKILAQAQVERSKAEEILLRAKERANALAEKEAKNYQVTENSINAARKAVSELTKERNNLNLATVEGIKRQQEINNLINQHNDFIKSNVSLQEKQKINIGNYASATNALNQVLRETPAFANSVQTGLMGISNNLPILTDAIKRLRAEGLNSRQILKILATSFLELGTVVSLVTTGVILAVQYFSSQTKETNKLDEATRSLADAQKKLASGIGEEVAQLTILYRTATNTNLSYKERGKAVDELQSKFPDYFENISREAILNGDAQRSYEMLTESIVKNAQVKASSDRLTKAFTEMADAQDRLERMRRGELYMEPDMEEMYKNRIAARKAEVDQIQKQLSAQQELANQKPQFFIDEAARKQYEAYEAEQKRLALLTEAQRKAQGKGGGKSKSTKETFDAGIQLSASVRDEDIKAFAQEIQNNAAYKEALDSIASQAAEITSLEKNALLKIEQDYAQGLIGYEEYEKEKTRIADIYAQARLKTEILSTKELLQDERLTGDQRLELIAHLQDLELQYAKKANEDKLKDDKETAAKRAQVEKELADKKKQLMKAVYDFSSAILDDMAQKELNALDTEIEANNKKTEKEILNIQASTLSQEDKEIAVAKARLKGQEQDEALENRKKDIQIRNFKLNKSAQALSATINTASAIMKNTAELGLVPAIPINIATGILGALQVATILAQPVPKYKEGTGAKGHPEDGPAIVGDGGEREFVVRDGKWYVTPDTPTMVELSKGDKVIPMHDMIAASGGTMSNKDLELLSSAAYFNSLNVDGVIRAVNHSSFDIVSAIQHTGSKRDNTPKISSDFLKYINSRL